MNPQLRQRIDYLITTVGNYYKLLIVPAIIGLVLATFYAFLIMPEQWTARQSFLIRDDLSGSAFKPGRFDSEESRKSAQETILEIARRPLVVRSVLKKLGPESFMVGSNWISDELIEDTQEVINISAPNGAEFGKTDAIVLTASASSRDRTRKFIEILSEEIISQTNRVRAMRFESMEMETDLAYKAAIQARDEAIDRLNDLDQQLGSDFGFLSIKGSQTAGVDAIKSEILQKQDELEKSEAILGALQQAFNNPETASQLPSEVLVAQPTLEKTMSKLLDLLEELHVAKGRFADKHARVRGIEKSIEFAQQQLYDSLTGEMAGVQAGIGLKKRQIARLNDRIEKIKARLIRFSKSRSKHLALSTQVKQLSETANTAKSAWSEIQSRTKAARMVGLLTPTDVAQVNSRPDGIGKKYAMLAGLIAGLMIGVGLIFAIAPPMKTLPTDPSASATASTPKNNRRLETSGQRHVPQQSTPAQATAGNSIASESFQQAAFATQTAANAMQLAATDNTAPQETTSPPAKPDTPQEQPATATKEPTTATKEPTTANTRKQLKSDPLLLASLSDTASTIPRDIRSQPVGNRTKNKPQPQASPVNVRPVDLAKSASENNEFVRVNTPSDVAPTTPQAPNSRQKVKTDTNVSKSARAIADTVSAAKTQAPQRDSASTSVLNDDSSPQAPEQPLESTAGNDPFVLTPDGKTSAEPTSTKNDDLSDAIPDQIRKLSESIVKFGKNKFKKDES